ncbi:transposase [Agrobacterium tumefaciens]|jgi:transposase|uniref:Orf_Bo209 n=3 Tax=Rhizobium/Agrobacterium group TaxID=227290 RepID=A5WYC4_AGRTU|nr:MULTISPECIES: transposase [Agrobacterium]AAZ50592.1 orf_Bo209 [Agrobacterium tumefaciens]ASK49581.1 sarcosine oxidase [Agrobacterium larrymoorei]KEY50202.1 hypothetical protein EN41_10780 [Agrobacterium tumefaciens]NSZ00733.1 transposase [Agrobacterium tumefaciens]NSZ39656.1 transposase [Agrobacterium tumefaciens]
MDLMKILTGVERRRDWSDDDKLQILEEAAASGARIVDVAHRHDIRPQQIYTRRREVRGDQPSGFVPAVALIASEPISEAERPNATAKPTTAKRSVKPSRIEIGCKGVCVLKVEADTAPDVLKALIRSLKGHDSEGCKFPGHSCLRRNRDAQFSAANNYAESETTMGAGRVTVNRACDCDLVNSVLSEPGSWSFTFTRVRMPPVRQFTSSSARRPSILNLEIGLSRENSDPRNFAGCGACVTE